MCRSLHHENERELSMLSSRWGVGDDVEAGRSDGEVAWLPGWSHSLHPAPGRV